MTIQNYTDVVNLLRILSLRDDQVAAFFVGEDKRVLEASKSDLIYPFVWLEYADGQGLDNRGGALMGLYDCRVFILGNNALGDDAGEERTLQQTEDILFRLLLRLRALALKALIKFDLSGAKWMRVKAAQIDNNFGWELIFSLGDYRAELCVNESLARAVALIELECPASPSEGDLSIGLTSISQSGDYSSDFATVDYSSDITEQTVIYSVEWSGSCEEKEAERALYNLAEKINADEGAIAEAEAFGRCLILRSKEPESGLGLSLGAGDFTFIQKLTTV